jgi:hypothetical protein
MQTRLKSAGAAGPGLRFGGVWTAMILTGSVPGYLLVAYGAPEISGGGGTRLAVVATIAIASFIAGVTVLACVGPA